MGLNSCGGDRYSPVILQLIALSQIYPNEIWALNLNAITDVGAHSDREVEFALRGTVGMREVVFLVIQGFIKCLTGSTKYGTVNTRSCNQRSARDGMQVRVGMKDS